MIFYGRMILGSESMKLKKSILGNKRKDYLSWDEFFMGISKLSAGRSKDPNTQVGACIVSKDNRILSTGYNGAPNNFSDDDFPWERDGAPLDTKYMYVCHAEANAIDNFRGYKKEMEGSRIYVDLFTCNECAKKIIQNGIKEVIYLSDKYKDSESTIASKKLFDKCRIKYKKLEKNGKKIIEVPLEENKELEYIEEV